MPETTATLPGRSRTIVVEPLRTPVERPAAKPPRPGRTPSPRRREREPEPQRPRR